MPDRSADGTSGRFWTTDDPDTTVPGRITLKPGWPRVEIYEPLVPSLRVVSVREGVTEYEPADTGSEDLTVHGQLLGVAGNSTLLHARVVRLSGSVGGALQEQVLEGRHALIGGHVGPDTSYKRFRFRVRFIEYWAELEGLAVTVEDPAGRVAIEYEAPTIEEVLFSSIDGSVSLQSQWSVPQPEFTGISLHIRSWIYINLAIGIPIEVVLNDYVLPTSVLLSLLFRQECPAVDVEVYSAELERWLTVVSPGLGDDVRDRPAEPLLSRRMTLGWIKPPGVGDGCRGPAPEALSSRASVNAGGSVPGHGGG